MTMLDLALRRRRALLLVVLGLAACKREPAPTATPAPAEAAPTTTTSTTTTTTLPPPPPVWRGARWGMRPAEVLAAFPGEAQSAALAFGAPRTGTAAVAIPAYEADGAHFRVLFGFTGDALDHVQLQSSKADASTCEDVEKRLTAEHGAPASSTDTRTSMQTHEVAWSTPREAITLACSEKPSLGFRTVTLDYAAAPTR
jgi:hypothetical protein